MRCFIFFVCFILVVYNVDNKIVLDLYRQQTPREVILNAPNIPDYNIWLDWLKKPYSEYRTNDTIPLLKFLDMEYYAVIGVGSPGKPMRVAFDTAWSTSWLISKDCPTLKFGCWFHNKYDHKHSSTYRENGEKYLANEGSYNMSGYYSSDVLKLAHTSVNQTFVEMDDIPYWYIFSKVDGVIGLGLPFTKYPPFISNIISQTNITKPIFSIYLNRDKSSKKGGSIILGEIDKKHIHQSNNITFVPINPTSQLWEFNADGIYLKVKNETITICNTDCTALADTTANGIIIPQKVLDQVNKQIGAKPLAFGKYEVDCDTVNRLPFFNFVIGGTYFNLTGTDYTQKLSLGPITLCISAFTGSTSVTTQNRWILGGAFLAKYYTIYDMEHKQMGFVRAA